MTKYEEERAKKFNADQEQRASRDAAIQSIKDTAYGSARNRDLAKINIMRMNKTFQGQDANAALGAQQLAGQGANQAAADERQGANQLAQLSAANKMNTAAADTAFSREQLLAMQGGRAEAAQNRQKNLIEALRVTADMRGKDEKPLSPAESLSMAHVLVGGGGGGGEAGDNSGVGLSFGGRTAPQTTQGAVQASAAPQSNVGYMPGAGYSTIVPGQAPVQNAQTPEEAAITRKLYSIPQGELTRDQIMGIPGVNNFWREGPKGPAGDAIRAEYGGDPVAMKRPQSPGGTSKSPLIGDTFTAHTSSGVKPPRGTASPAPPEISPVPTASVAANVPVQYPGEPKPWGHVDIPQALGALPGMIGRAPGNVASGANNIWEDTKNLFRPAYNSAASIAGQVGQGISTSLQDYGGANVPVSAPTKSPVPPAFPSVAELTGRGKQAPNPLTNLQSNIGMTGLPLTQRKKKNATLTGNTLRGSR